MKNKYLLDPKKGIVDNVKMIDEDEVIWLLIKLQFSLLD